MAKGISKTRAANHRHHHPRANHVKVRNFAYRNKINYPSLFGSKKTKALFDSGETMPFSVVIDRDGNIRERIEGLIFADEFNEKIKPLIIHL